MKTLMATATLTLTTAGLLGATVPAAQADVPDRIVTGSCSEGAEYTMRLSDAGDDPNRVRLAFNIDSDKPGRRWNLEFKRDDGKTFRDSPKTTKENGNLKTSKIAVTDDDTRFTVIAEAGYGETCRQALRIVRRDRD